MMKLFRQATALILCPMLTVNMLAESVPSAADFMAQICESAIFQKAESQDALGDYGSSLGRLPAAQALGKTLSEMNVKTLQEIVSYPRSKVEFDALRIGFECMTPHQYLASLKTVLSSQPVHKERATQLLHPFVNYNHLLEDNWESNEVQELVDLALKAIVDDKDLASYLNNIRTGAAKKSIDEYRRESGEHVKSVILLSKPIPEGGSTVVDHQQGSSQSRKFAAPQKSAPPPHEAPTSSAPWHLILVMIAAALSLLWLLLKRRS